MGKVFTMDEEDRRLHLITMCPRDLQDRILNDSERYDTYQKARAEVIEAIARSKRPRPGLNALGHADHEHRPEAPAGDELQGLDMEELDDEEQQMFPFSGDKITKAGLSGGAYELMLPDHTADPQLVGAPRSATLVLLLRHAARFGGFPGFVNIRNRPEQLLEALTEGWSRSRF